MKKRKTGIRKIGIRKIIQMIAAFPITILFIKNFSYSATILLIITAIGGAFYCGYLCPFGFLQELISVLGKKFKVKKREIPDKLDKVLKMIRYVLFVMVTFLAIPVVYSLLKYDARANLFLILTGKPIKIIMVVSILFFGSLSLFYNKIFCKYFCIQGAKYGLASSFRLFAIKRNDDSCINCKRCDRVCDMGIKVSACDKSVKSLNCINCFECIKQCPKPNTLTYGMVQGKTRIKKVVYGICALLVLFCINQYKDKSNPEEQAVETKKEVVEVVEVVKEKKEVIDNSIYYVGTGAGYNGDIKVKVGVDNDNITKITILEHQDDWDWYSKAKKGVVSQILEKQSTDVDIVTGATYSSKGIIEAVKDALENKVQAE